MPFAHNIFQAERIQPGGNFAAGKVIDAGFNRPAGQCERARRDPATLTLAPTVAVRPPIHGAECIHPFEFAFH